MSASYFRTLIAYNRWAWGRVLAQVGELTREEYASRQLNFGSVRSTLSHWACRPSIGVRDLRGWVAVGGRYAHSRSERCS